MPDNLPGYDAWKTHDPADDLCAHCGANLTSRECRRDRAEARIDAAAGPLKGLAPWVGGKRHLARRLVTRIEAVTHDLYAEPFVGMGGVFFRRRRPARVEAVNDRAGDVVNLFRVVKHHPEALLAELRLQLVSRSDFERLLRVDSTTLTDVQRAARFLALQRMGYGGRPGSHTFPARSIQPSSFDAAGLRTLIEAAHDRLARVTIEHLPYAEFIARYDRPGALLYLDPPYFGYENWYGRDLFSRDDFTILSALLATLRGHFIMSINDTPEIRHLFAGFVIEEEPATYRLNGPKSKRVTELVISNL